MKEFGGVSSNVFKIMEKKRKKCHSKLFIRFDTFSSPVIHENRSVDDSSASFYAGSNL